MDNLYQYDVVSNVLQVHNNAPVAPAGLLGGGTNYAYGYDDLYRLTSASGNWKGKTDAGTDLRHRYTYTMAYDNMHNVMSKVQKHETAPGNTGNDWTARYDTSYMLNYKYDGSQPHAPSTIIDQPNVVPTSTCCDPNDPSVKFMHYEYDKKGNPTGINKETCTVTEASTTHIWDEENRLQAVDTNPSTPEADGVAMYTYDAGGERILKQVYAGSYTIRTPFGTVEVPYYTHTLYPNGLVSMTLSFDRRVNTYRRNYTKHYYAGTQRISGALGSSVAVGDFNCNWLIIPFGTGGAPINEKEVALQKKADAVAHRATILEKFGINGVDYGQGGGYSEQCTTDFSGQEETDRYWYHPDHLGSSSFVTGIDGEVNQNIEYFPSGETFVENHLNSYNVPYKFNAKELDDETGYYYYGARYYNPRVSLWLNVDPLAEKGPQYSPYIYCFNNPVKLTDPDGRWPDPPFSFGARFGFSLGFGSNGLNFNLTASIGVQANHSIGDVRQQAVAFASASVYGGQQLGTSSMTKGLQYDLTAGAYYSVGAGEGSPHNFYTLNSNTASPFSNNFDSSLTYGQARTFNSAINAGGDGPGWQTQGIIGMRFGDKFSLSSNNDAKIYGTSLLFKDTGSDAGWTGGIVLNVGGVEAGYQNFSGYWPEFPTRAKGDLYSAENRSTGNGAYHQSLNRAFNFIRKGNASGGIFSGAWFQNFLHDNISKDAKYIYNNQGSVNGTVGK